MVTNCSGERSFSEVKRIKIEIRATLDQDRLNNSSLCIEHDLLRGMDMEKIIHEFSILMFRKHTFWYGADTSLCLHTFWYGDDTSLCF